MGKKEVARFEGQTLTVDFSTKEGKSLADLVLHSLMWISDAERERMYSVRATIFSDEKVTPPFVISDKS